MSERDDLYNFMQENRPEEVDGPEPQVDPRLQDARDMRDKMNLFSGLLSGFQQMNAAASGIDPNYRTADALKAQGELAVSDYREDKATEDAIKKENRALELLKEKKERQARQDEMDKQKFDKTMEKLSLDLDEANLDFQDAQATRDPNSPQSRFIQDAYIAMQKQMGQPVNEESVRSIGGHEIYKVSPWMQKMYSSKLTADQNKKRDDLSNARIENEKRRLEQQEQQEERRKASFAKSFRDKMLSDPRFKDLKKQEQAFQQIPAIMEAAKEGNEVAVSSIGTRMARAMGEVGVLTDADVVRYLGNQSYGRKILDWYNRGMKGQIPVETADDIQEVSQIMQDLVSTQVMPVYEEYASSAINSYPGELSPEKALKILGAPGYIDPVFKDAKKLDELPKQPKSEATSNMVKMQAPDGRIKLIPKDKVEAAKKAGAKEI